MATRTILTVQRTSDPHTVTEILVDGPPEWWVDASGEPYIFGDEEYGSIVRLDVGEGMELMSLIGAREVRDA